MKKLILILSLFLTVVSFQSCKAQNSNFFWSYPTEITVKYGYLYNWYAATDARNIAPVGFHVPTYTEYETLYTAIGGKSTSAPKLREIGIIYWSSDNSNTNEYGFNARGNGRRSDSNGTFLENKSKWTSWCSNTVDASLARFTYIVFNSNVIQVSADYKKTGHALRFIADTGTPTTATGNDGKIYKCVTIGSQTWTAANSCETKYRNGDWITGYDGGVYTPISNATWAGLTIEAMCAYGDLESNARY